MNFQKTMPPKKICNPAAIMPFGIINPQIYVFVFKAIHNFSQHLQKTIGVALNPFHDAMQSLYRINPAKDIQPLLMLASGIHIRLHTPFSPYSAKLRVQGKTRFVLEKNYLTTLALPGHAEFFLPSLQTVQLPDWLPAQNDIWVALANTQDSSPAAVHDAHESGYDAAALSIVLSPPHPNDFEKFRTPKAISLRPRPDPSKLLHQTARDVQTWHGLQWHPTPLCLSFVSISQLTSEIIRIVQLFALISSQTITAIMLLCVSRSMPRGSSRLFAKELLCLYRYGLCLVLSLCASRLVNIWKAVYQ